MAHIKVIHDPIGETLTVYFESLVRTRYAKIAEAARLSDSSGSTTNLFQVRRLSL